MGYLIAPHFANFPLSGLVQKVSLEIFFVNGGFILNQPGPELLSRVRKMSPNVLILNQNCLFCFKMTILNKN